MRQALFLVLAAVSISSAQTAPTDALKAKFAPEEQWLLTVVLADPKQQAAFDIDAVSAAKSPADQDRYVNRWRQRTAAVATEYRRLLDTDIVPNAPSIEKMVSETEFNLTNYWIAAQPPDRQKQILSDISQGNTALKYLRGTVEAKIRDSRRQASTTMGQYLASAPVVAALAYREPSPHAPKAIDQAEEARRKAEQAKNSPKPEDAADKADQTFSGKPGDGGAPPVQGKPGETQPPSLTPSQPGVPQGGLVVAPPPKPVLDREKPASGGSMIALMAKKFAPAVGGGLVGGILGFIFGGPLGMIVGALIGAYVGHHLYKDVTGT